MINFNFPKIIKHCLYVQILTILYYFIYTFIIIRILNVSDDDSFNNSLEDVDLSCDGGKCDSDGQDVSTSGWTTTKKRT